MRSGQPFFYRRTTQIVRRLVAAALIAIAAAVSVTCGGSTAVETVVGPDGVRCQTTLAAQNNPVVPDGGSVSVNVTAPRDCTWSASTDTSWMQLSATSGQGDGTVSVNVARNDLPAARSGAVLVNDQRVSINQQPRPCTYELRASVTRMGRLGGRGNVAVDTAQACAWTASSSADWLRVPTPSGSGPGTVEFEMTDNTGSPREASITVGGQSVSLSQDGIGGGGQPSTCNGTVNPTTITPVAAGGTFSVSISIGSGCGWNATSSAPWVTLGPASTGQGSSSLALVVARNTAAARSATVSVAQQAVTVNQAAAPACTASIDPASLSFGTAGGDGRVRVTSPEGCEWNTTGGTEWARVTNARGSGNGEVRYTVATNGSASPRSATLSIGGRNHSVNQQAAAPTCTYSLDPGSRTFGAGAAEAAVRVVTQTGCQWTAGVSGSPGWVTINGQDSGSGEGSFSYSVQANGGASSRNATIAAGGQNHTIAQEAAAPTCTYRVEPGSLSFPAVGGDGRFTIVTQANCAWQATSGADWARLATSSGSGESSIAYSVQENTSTSTRTTTVTVNGQPHTVSQEARPAPACTYSVQPGSADFGAGPGDGRFDVITSLPMCTWEPQTGAGWVSVSGGVRTGSGPVTYTVQANAIATGRSTTITAGNQSHTVSQAGAAQPPCSYTLNPTSQNFPAGGGSSSFTVTTQANCSWTAARGADWVTITSTSATSVSFSVAANQAASTRQTTVTVNNQGFNVTQDAAAPACSYTVSPGSGTFPAPGGTAQFTITAPNGCSWTASSGAAWVTPASASGSGTQSVSFAVQANTAAARQTTIGVTGGASYTVSQAAGPTTPAAREP